MNAVFGKKLSMTQRYDEKGLLKTVTMVSVDAHTVVGAKTADKDGYSALQLGVGTLKKSSKALAGVYKGSSVPALRKEVRTSVVKEVGETIQANDVVKPGDLVRVTGYTKGKGFTGVVKRHGFAGGPKTHGQSDRHRAPGSIGAGTTMGRVLKGLRMAGRSGNEQFTLRNLTVLFVRDDGTVYLSGPVPGHYGSLLRIEKIGENKKFSPMVLTQEDEAEIVKTQTLQDQNEAQQEKNEEVEVAVPETVIEEPSVEEKA